MPRKKILFLCVCAVCLLVGCFGREGTEETDSSGCIESEYVQGTISENAQESSMERKEDGVYYAKIDEKIVTNYIGPNDDIMFDFLHYNGGIYVSEWNSHYYYAKEMELSAILGQKVGTVYGYKGIYWSGNKEELYRSTTEETVYLEGILYQMREYDEEYRLCIVWEEDETLNLAVFAKQNDIFLSLGSELFRDRMHLEASIEISYSYYPSNAEEKREKRFSIGDNAIKRFLKALLEGKFLDRKADDYPDNVYAMDWYTLTFEDKFGIGQAIRFNEEGYVYIRGVDENIIAKIDTLACKEMLKLLQE